MKNKFTPLSFLALFLTISLNINGQEIIESNILPQDPTCYDLVLFSESFLPVQENTKKVPNDNVFIVQIGEGNFSNVKISAEENSYSLAQLGNGNFASLDVTVRKFEGNVLQNGYNNFTTTFSYAPSTDLSLEVSQNGNNNNFFSHGTNSIGNKMSFDISGDSQTIIVRNFK